MMACRRRERFVSDLRAKPAAGPKKAKTARKKIRRFISVNQTIAAFDSRSIHFGTKATGIFCVSCACHTSTSEGSPPGGDAP